MVYCFRAELVFSTANRRDAVYADIETRIAGKPKFSDLVLVAQPTEFTGEPSILAAFRFSSRADLDDLAARIESFATGQRTPRPGSWYELHECPHDGDAAPCATEPPRVW